MAVETEAELNLRLSKVAVSQYQLRQYHKKIKALIANGNNNSSSAKEYLDLSEYAESGKSFEYSSTTSYRYNGGNTTLERCCEESAEEGDVFYGIFKVNDVDLYIAYIITSSTTDDVTTETFTYYDKYTSANLYSLFKPLFEIGTYATIYKIEARTKFSGTAVTEFVDSENKRCRFAYVTGITYEDILASTGRYLIAVKQDNTQVWLYTLTGGYYVFTAKYTSYNNSAIASALSAIVDCATTIYDSNVTYPDGSVGAELTQLTKKIALKTSIATTSQAGIVKSATTGTDGTDYNVEVSTDGTMKVNVPETDITGKADARKVIDASTVDYDEESAENYIDIEASTPDEMLDWRNQSHPLAVSVNAECHNEVTIYYTGGDNQVSVEAAEGVSLQKIGDITPTSGVEYCMVIQDGVYIIAPLSSSL